MAPEILANPGRTRGRSPAPVAGAGAPRAFHRRLPGYGPTPLVAAPALAADLGLADLRIKVEANRFGLPAFKMLGASWATYRALVEQLGAEPRGTTSRGCVAPLRRSAR